MISEKALISIEVEKNEHRYQFIMQVGVPFGEAYDVVFEVLETITEMAKKAKDKAKRKPVADDSKKKEGNSDDCQFVADK